MNSVIQAAYVKQLALPAQIGVTDREVQDQVSMVRSQNRLGSNDRVFKDVLNEFWGWSVTDFERELSQQLLQQKVANLLDTSSSERASNILKQLQGGADFATLAAANSDDATTKTNGGQYPQPILKSDHSVPPQLAAIFFSLKAGQMSDVLNTGYTRELIKVIYTDGNSVHAAHIQLAIKDITEDIKPLATKQPSHQYIKF